MRRPLTMHVAVEGELLAAALECEAAAFLHHYGNTAEQLAEEYGPYEEHSTFLALADRDGDVVAATRIIRPNTAPGLKALVDAGNPPWSADPAASAAAAGLDPRFTWEVATIGVRPDAATSAAPLALALYHGILCVCRANAPSSFVAILDERARRILRSVALVMHPLPGTGPASYLGSAASTPMYVHAAQLMDHQRRTSPDAYRLLTLGVGLDDVVVPPLETFRFPSAATPGRTPAEADVALALPRAWVPSSGVREPATAGRDRA